MLFIESLVRSHRGIEHDNEDDDTLSNISIASSSFDDVVGDEAFGDEPRVALFYGRSPFADLEEDDPSPFDQHLPLRSRPASASSPREEEFGAAEVAALRATTTLLERNSEELDRKLAVRFWKCAL